MRPVYLLAVIALCVISCQKEISSETENPPGTDSTATTGSPTVVLTAEEDGSIFWYDSTIFRKGTNKMDEVHYLTPIDSSIRSYLHDASGKLVEIAAEDGIMYKGGVTESYDVTRMQFVYNAQGNLRQINLEYMNHAPTTVWLEFSQQAGKQIATMYDTGNTDMENRIIYYRFNADNYLEMDSSVRIGAGGANLGAVSSVYTYDNDNNVTKYSKNYYINGAINVENKVTVTRHPHESPYEALRQQSFKNLANWFVFTEWYALDNFSLVYWEQPRKLFSGSVTDSYGYATPTPSHHHGTMTSTIEVKDNKLVKREVTEVNDSFTHPIYITENFYY
jgi:hypothetical protein